VTVKGRSAEYLEEIFDIAREAHTSREEALHTCVHLFNDHVQDSEAEQAFAERMRTEPAAGVY
jgi:hypothetical protein